MLALFCCVFTPLTSIF